MAELASKKMEFLDDAMRSFIEEGSEKFKKGSVEHKDDFDLMTKEELLKEIKHECIDLFFYIHKLQQKEMAKQNERV